MSDEERRDERGPHAGERGERPPPPAASPGGPGTEDAPAAPPPRPRAGSPPAGGEGPAGAPGPAAPVPRPRPRWHDEELAGPAAAGAAPPDDDRGEPPAPPRPGEEASPDSRALAAERDPGGASTGGPEAPEPEPPRLPSPRPRRDDAPPPSAPGGDRVPTPRPRREEDAAPPEEPSAPPAPAATTPPPGAPPDTSAAPEAAAPRAAPLDDAFFADLAAGARAERDEEAERSYRDLVRQVDRYREQGYDLYGMVGYPKSGKTHALKALVHRLHGFDPTAREQFRRARAPGQTEAWPFYYAYTGTRGERWVFMDPGGELFARLRSNDWRTDPEAGTGMLHTVRHCKGLLLLLHLGRGHLDRDAAGFVAGMEEDEVERERAAQQAQEEIELFDQFLLFARALAAEPDGLAALVRRAADAGLDEALRPYRESPRLAAPVAVLFTQADRLADGRDFALGDGRYLAPQTGLAGVAPFVARHLPALFTSVAAHARRFHFDFVQSYVERPAPGGGVPVWTYGDEPLSVGLLPAIEFLERAAPGGGLGRWAIETRAALRLDRLLHPGRWRGVEIEL